MSSLEKSDRCLNHAIGVTMAYARQDYQRFAHSTGRKYKGNNSPLFNKLLGYMKPPTESSTSVESFPCENFHGHSTAMHSFVKDGKRYVWYTNPWGFELDLKRDNAAYSAEIIQQAQQFGDKTLRDITRQEMTSPLFEGKTNEVKTRINSFRVLAYGLRQSKKRSFQRLHVSLCPGHGVGHVFSLLVSLKILTKANHLVLLNPTESMPAEGPQVHDGVFDFLCKHTQYSLGACSIWTSIYTKAMKRVITDQLSKRRSATSILNTVRGKLASLRFLYDGEKTPQDTIAKIMIQSADLQEVKGILAFVYDMIPEREDVFSYTTRFSENNSALSSWHHEMFRRLDLVFGIVQNMYTAYAKDNSVTDIDRVHGVHSTAAMIEMVRIASSQVKRAEPKFIDVTGRFALYVTSNKMDDVHTLKKFSGLIKLLCTCKHNAGIFSGVDARDRGHDKGHILTRLQKEHVRNVHDVRQSMFGNRLGRVNKVVQKRKRERRSTRR